MRSEKLQSASLFAAFGTLLAAAVTPTPASISQAVMFRNVQSTQTGNGNTLAPDAAYLTLRLYASTPNEYSIVQAFPPTPAPPVALTHTDPTDPTAYEYDSGFYPNQAAMDADFPKGTYGFTAVNLAPPDNATTMFDYSADAYAKSQPYLAGTNYADLQGMNPAQSFNFQFSPFIADAAATDPELFFTLFDATTGDVVFGDEFQPASTNGVTLPANTLLPNHAYVFDLDFSDRLTTTSNGADFPALLGFETRTEGSFQTGDVPEPTTLTLLAAATLLTPRLRKQNR